jgi:hypothetical protein
MKARTVFVAALMVTLFSSGMAWTQQSQSPADEQVQPRFIWGILINIALSRVGGFAWNIFNSWLESRITGGVSSLTGRVTSSLLSSLTGGASIGSKSAGAFGARSADVIVGTPSSALSVDGGKENYQGANFAIMVAEADGKTYSVRPVNQGFRTGERFKLRVISTFSGELTIENINPRSERNQIYPGRADQVVQLQSGKEIFIPLAAEDYFQFTRDAGREQLVINLVDPRAVGARASRNQVYRQDVSYGSNLVQEVTPETYPFISQGIELQHSAQ